jgi:hypothetical protein
MCRVRKLVGIVRGGRLWWMVVGVGCKCMYVCMHGGG